MSEAQPRLDEARNDVNKLRRYLQGDRPGGAQRQLAMNALDRIEAALRVERERAERLGERATKEFDRAETAKQREREAVEALRDALKLAEGVHGGDEMLVGEGGYYAIRDYLRGELAVLAEQEKEQP